MRSIINFWFSFLTNVFLDHVPLTGKISRSIALNKLLTIWEWDLYLLTFLSLILDISLLYFYFIFLPIFLEILTWSFVGLCDCCHFGEFFIVSWSKLLFFIYGFCLKFIASFLPVSFLIDRIYWDVIYKILNRLLH